MVPTRVDPVPGGVIERASGGVVGGGRGGAATAVVLRYDGAGGAGGVDREDSRDVLEEGPELGVVAGCGAPMQGEKGVAAGVLEGELAEAGAEAGLERGGEVTACEGEGGVVAEGEMVGHHVEEFYGHGGERHCFVVVEREVERRGEERRGGEGEREKRRGEEEGRRGGRRGEETR